MKARFRAPNDIEIGGRKVSGSSGYAAGRSAVLQGTVLVGGRRRRDGARPALARGGVARADDVSRGRDRRSAGLAARSSQCITIGLAEALGRDARARTSAQDELALCEALLRDEIGTDALRGRPHRRSSLRIGHARKLLIVLVNTDPRNPEELGAPFYHAAVAAAMDYEVDVICAATAGKLMRKGVAEAIRIKPGHDKTVYDWIRDAHSNGARFWACPANLDLFDMTEADLIPECKGLMGAAAMLQNIMSDDYRVLTY